MATLFGIRRTLRTDRSVHTVASPPRMLLIDSPRSVQARAAHMNHHLRHTHNKLLHRQYNTLKEYHHPQASSTPLPGLRNSHLLALHLHRPWGIVKARQRLNILPINLIAIERNYRDIGNLIPCSMSQEASSRKCLDTSARISGNSHQSTPILVLFYAHFGLTGVYFAWMSTVWG